VCVKPDAEPGAADKVIEHLKALSTNPGDVESFPGGVVFVPTTIGSVRNIAALPNVDWIGLPATKTTIERLIDDEE